MIPSFDVRSPRKGSRRFQQFWSVLLPERKTARERQGRPEEEARREPWVLEAEISYSRRLAELYAD